MQYGQYYVDAMPIGDDSGDTYVVVYKGDPNTDSDAEQEADFTVTATQETESGSLDKAIYGYMREHYPRQIGDRQGSLVCVDVIESDVAVWEGCGLQYAEDLHDGVMTLTDSIAFLSMLGRIGRRKRMKP